MASTPTLSSIRNSSGFLCGLKSTVTCIDEVHALRNAKSDLTKIFKYVVENSDKLWGLTASSVSKSLEDFYNIMNVVYPWYLGSFYEFRSLYCTTRRKYIGRHKYAEEITGLKDEEVFHKKIEPIVIFGESYLPVKYHYVDYTLTPEEQSIYRRVSRGIDLDESLSAEDWVKKSSTSKRMKSLESRSSTSIPLDSSISNIVLMEFLTQPGIFPATSHSRFSNA